MNTVMLYLKCKGNIHMQYTYLMCDSVHYYCRNSWKKVLNCAEYDAQTTFYRIQLFLVFSVSKGGFSYSSRKREPVYFCLIVGNGVRD